jgi:predicted Fe-S protein YdhL (DUF1289 family)
MRTLEEIATWGTLDDDDKRAVWQQLPLRRAERVASGSAAVDTIAESKP